MQDLREYSDNELSLQVFNDEYLYVEREHKKYLLALCREEFWFTDTQLQVLEDDLLIDQEEEED